MNVDDDKNAADYSAPEDVEERVSAYSNMVEIQFEEGTRPEVRAAPNGAMCEFVSEAKEFAADDINACLLKHKCTAAEPVFDDWPKDTPGEKELAGAEGVESPDLGGFYVLHFPAEENVRDIAERLRRYRGVKLAAPLPNTKPASARPTTIPTDPLLTEMFDKGEFQWYIERCGVLEAWECGFTGKGVVIADIDWGYEVEHPDLKGRLNLRRAFHAVSGSFCLPTTGSRNHGTAVMGLAGAAADNAGMAGIAFDADLWPIQVGDEPSANPCAWVKAIKQVMKFAVGESRRVVIIVEGTTICEGNITQINIIKAAIQRAIRGGAVVCVPAGNGGREVSMTDCATPEGVCLDKDKAPPDCCKPFEPLGIIVGATLMHCNLPWDESNFGEDVMVAAPGDPAHDLTCTADLSKLHRATFGATSGATAKVAGAVALMLQANRTLRHIDVVEIFKKTGVPVATKPLGRFLDCHAAVLAARNFRPAGS